MPFPIVSCSYHHLDLQSFGLIVTFYVTDLTSIVPLIRPEDESGFGAGLWTLAARLIEFTDSERERAEEEGGHFRSIASPVRPSVHPIESPGQWKRRRFLFRWRARFFFTPSPTFQPLSSISSSHPSDDSSCNAIFSSGDIEFRHYLGLGTGTNSHKIQ